MAIAKKATKKIVEETAKKVVKKKLSRPSGSILAVGMPAPDFTLPSHLGGEVSLSETRGTPVVLYFYPKDDTPGCTVEACDFRDQFRRFRGVKVWGVSPDSIARHEKFAQKFSLPFDLLADESHKIAEAYGVWVEKSMYGRTYFGIQRTTFLIDKDGVIKETWPNVKVKDHVNQVLEAAKKCL